MVEVDLDKMNVKVEANISLNGQFSTLGRGAYLYDSCDPSVNPAYCQKYGESISSDIQPVSYNVNSVDQDFPFKASISASFSADNALSISGDEIILDLGGWISHIRDDNLNAQKRILPYYPDFQYTDTYIFQISFNKAVEMLEPMPIVTMENSYGGIMVNYSNQDDGSILIMSKVIVAAEKIPANNIKDISDIQTKMQEMNNLKIKLRLAE
jgi:hypothetical protein